MRAVGPVRKFAIAVLPCLALVLSASPPIAEAATPDEVWVLAEGPRHVRIVTTATPETAVPEPIDLNVGFPPPAPSPVPVPRGIAFSTLPPGDPSVVFVSQGNFIRVISKATRTLRRTWDISGTFPPGRTLERLGRMEPARPVRLPQPGGGFAWRTFLHVPATVMRTDGQREPWYVVLDQSALVCLGGSCPSPVIVRGPLPLSASAQAEGVDVAVMNDPLGAERQRVWITARDLTQPRGIAYKLSCRGGGTHGTWAVDTSATRIRMFNGATTTPDNIPVVMPYEGESPIWGTGCSANTPSAAAPDAGSDTCMDNLGQTGCFQIGGTTLGGTDIGRLGFGSGSLYAATTLSVSVGTSATSAPLAPEAAGTLWRIATGTGASQTYAIGEDPADVVVLDPVRTGKVFVSNRGSDNLSVLRPNGTMVTVPLAGAAGSTTTTAPPVPSAPTTCMTCPGAIATQRTACSATVNSIVETNRDGQNDALDVVISWTPSVGCSANQTWLVLCTCDGSATECPSDCTPTQAVSSARAPAVGPCGFGAIETVDEIPDTGGWGEINPLGTSGNEFVHYDIGDLLGRLSYSVTPDGI